MGRIMSFGQDGQLVRDFDKSEYDFLRRYGRTPDEVMAENARLREVVSDGEENARFILQESRALQAENAKLVDVLHEVETEAVYAYRCLQQDCVTTAESSEHFFKKWWHAECMNDNRLKRIDQLEAENARLRELVRILAYCMSDGRDCDRCALNGADMPKPRISACDSLPEMLRELGIGVVE